ncbi:MAG: hypothetical protein L3J45_00320 [Flavobacteriaceae bacterium]|nr:hypothetical protein [Flavobacteriaceae bacterium]
MSQSNNSKKVAVLLAVLFVLSLIYGVYSKIENTKFINQLNTEKTEIKADLNKMIKQYDVAIKKNGALTGDLKSAQANIISLRDSLIATKKTDYSIIKHLRNKLYSLEKINKRLFFLADSTKIANTLLTQSLDSSEVLLEAQKSDIKLLKEQNLKLTNDVTNASAIQLYAVSATGVKLKTSGKLVITTRASRANRIRVCARIAKNILAKKGDRDLYVQIFNPLGKLLGKNEAFEINGETLKYSDKTNFFYQNINTKICILAPVSNKKDLVKGVYKIKVYAEGKLLGKLDLNLR